MSNKDAKILNLEEKIAIMKQDINRINLKNKLREVTDYLVDRMSNNVVGNWWENKESLDHVLGHILLPNYKM